MPEAPPITSGRWRRSGGRHASRHRRKGESGFREGVLPHRTRRRKRPAGTGGNSEVRRIRGKRQDGAAAATAACRNSQRNKDRAASASPTRGNPSFGWRAGATGAERKAVRQIPKIGNRPRRSHSVRGGIVKRRLVGEPRPVELAGVEPASKQGARRLSTRLAAIRSFFPFTAGGSLARDPASSFRPPAEASGGLSLKR
ncbi:hypothetical protein BN3659_01852 [Alistipes sp. CHKCI003]|nr:hypothetical protein BN3659_01852 [Alistipes sp. CHKCI003]